ncbi:hypothetical protein T11_8605 [Trichinella zimbabwensis]|uniref:Uncharacterized protein n=1 Tax=Trichinella zimbabwensis TaxID=268475 RepID=A0A0V1F2Z0_9BILA|nr:hypothetical protein T11_8605 [Trichinella zimbabwensis]
MFVFLANLGRQGVRYDNQKVSTLNDLFPFQLVLKQFPRK